MTNGLTAAELAQMRADLSELFPDTCSIMALSQTSDGAGGFTESWGASTSNVPCRVDYKAGGESVTAEAITPYQQAVISMGYAVVVTPANRIQVGSNVFSVQAGNAGQSWKASTVVSVELVP